MKRKLFLLSCAAVLIQTTYAQDTEARQKRRWRIAVIIPETHLAQPHIPDPAAETEVCRQLIDAGYKVVDQDIIKSIRYDERISRIIKGGKDAEIEATRIGKRLSADIIVTGEAFTQQVGSPATVKTALGDVTQVVCRARVELKAIRADTGEKIWSEALHKTGTPDATVELASKITLQQAAEDITEKLLEKLNKLALGETQILELMVRGIKSAKQGGDLEEALQKLPGVRNVSPGNLEGTTYDLELEMDKAAVKGLAKLLETHTTLKPFRLRVDRSSGSKLVIDIG